MQDTKNILPLFWKHIENSKTKTAKKIYNWLNNDNLNAIQLDGDIFWNETTNSSTVMPDYVYNYIKKWGISLGYKYLYDIPTIN